MRPQWSGVTSVDVYGDFAGDWTTPFMTLTRDSSGTFTGTHTVANGTYNYMFRVHGSADNIVKDGTYLLDEENAMFSAHPDAGGPPGNRSVSTVTVPQNPNPIFHLKGVVLYDGHPQPCFPVDLEAGELRTPQGGVISEHTTANYSETGTDGTFDFPVAAGELMPVVRYPFELSGANAPYPDPSVTPSIGYARTSLVLAADTTLDALEVSYPSYASFSPMTSTASLPVTFSFDMLSDSQGATAAVIGTNVPGNDPAWWLNNFPNQTSDVFDGGIGNNKSVTLGAQYYWGVWQRRSEVSNGTVWATESLLLPITFQ